MFDFEIIESHTSKWKRLFFHKATIEYERVNSLQSQLYILEHILIRSALVFNQEKFVNIQIT